ncbi:MAG: hypothetical protein ACRDV9_11025 [Acidimicrobiia bacterium]
MTPDRVDDHRAVDPGYHVGVGHDEIGAYHESRTLSSSPTASPLDPHRGRPGVLDSRQHLSGGGRLQQRRGPRLQPGEDLRQTPRLEQLVEAGEQWGSGWQGLVESLHHPRALNLGCQIADGRGGQRIGEQPGDDEGQPATEGPAHRAVEHAELPPAKFSP